MTTIFTWLGGGDLGVVADHEAISARELGPAGDSHVLADEAGLDPPVQVLYRRALQHDRVLDLGVLDDDVVSDRRVRADVRVRQHRAAADDRRPADRRALEPRPALDRHAPLDARVDQLALVPLFDLVEDQAVRLEHVLDLPGVLPPAADDVRVHPQPRVHQVLDRLGDLELASLGRGDRARRVEDRRGEHVDADQREVGGGLGRLLRQPEDAPALVELGDAVVLRVGHRRQEDHRVRLLGAERLDEAGDPVAQQVVAQVHHEWRIGQVLLGGQHGVREPEWLVLLYVGDVDPERRAVSHHRSDLAARLRRDDDPDVADAGRGHRLDAIEEHRLVRHGDELLRARVGERPQARAAAAGEDQTLQGLHQYVPPSLEWSHETMRVGVNRRPTRFGACFSTIAVTDSSSVPA